jgi:membrane protease YdiL (CAAX protease family)
MIGVYAVMLALSIVYGWFTRFGLSGEGPNLGLMLGIEVVTTAIVSCVWWTMPRPADAPPLPPPVPMAPPTLWVVSLLVLFFAVGVNLAYHAVIRKVLGVGASAESAISGLVLPVLVFCIQPALVEELFFRRLVLDRLHMAMGAHAAVAVSSLMFGLAHIGVPLSIPLLTLLGALLGYARLVSGGLALPMAMHFLHNAIVLVL